MIRDTVLGDCNLFKVTQLEKRTLVGNILAGGSRTGGYNKKIFFKCAKWKTPVPFSGERPTEESNLTSRFFYFLNVCTEGFQGCHYFFCTYLGLEAILVRLMV